MSKHSTETRIVFEHPLSAWLRHHEWCSAWVGGACEPSCGLAAAVQAEASTASDLPWERYLIDDAPQRFSYGLTREQAALRRWVAGELLSHFSMREIVEVFFDISNGEDRALSRRLERAIEELPIAGRAAAGARA
jgi:hypothetical protein